MLAVGRALVLRWPPPYPPQRDHPFNAIRWPRGRWASIVQSIKAVTFGVTFALSVATPQHTLWPLPRG
jgi:hypothetical protein